MEKFEKKWWKFAGAILALACLGIVFFSLLTSCVKNEKKNEGISKESEKFFEERLESWQRKKGILENIDKLIAKSGKDSLLQDSLRELQQDVKDALILSDASIQVFNRRLNAIQKLFTKFDERIDSVGSAGKEIESKVIYLERSDKKTEKEIATIKAKALADSISASQRDAKNKNKIEEQEIKNLETIKELKRLRAQKESPWKYDIERKAAIFNSKKGKEILNGLLSSEEFIQQTTDQFLAIKKSKKVKFATSLNPDINLLLSRMTTKEQVSPTMKKVIDILENLVDTPLGGKESDQ
jgi:hypothetical protein